MKPLSMLLTPTWNCIRIGCMKDEQQQPIRVESEPARDEWVRVNPERSPYQRLHLCTYLAELPDLAEPASS